MSDRYPFRDDKTLATHDAAVVWSEQVVAQSALHFSNVSDSTLSDSINESYVTAVDENETQYLSVLETTNDITLEDLHNLTLGNSKLVPQESIEFNNENLIENAEENVVDTGEQQVVVFSVEGSDDLYGIQFAPDDEGNMQKYQFKFRTTEDGQLEAIPESIQLLLNDEDTGQKTSESDEVLVQEVESEEVQETQVFFQDEPALQEGNILLQEDEPAEEPVLPEDSDCDKLQIYIKGEPEQQSPALQKDCSADLEYSEVQEAVEEQQELQYSEAEAEFSDEDHYTEETIDVKAGILEEHPASIKQELYKEESQDSSATITQNEGLETGYQMFKDQAELEIQCEENNMQDVPGGHELQQHVEEDIDGNYVEIDEARETVLEYEQYVPEEIQQVFEETTTDTTDSQGLQTEQDDNHYEQLFIQENHILSKVKTTDDQSVQLVEEEEEETVDGTFVNETGIENDSDNDDYQIVEGLHITAEGDIGEESSSPVQFQEPETILQEVLERAPTADRANILKQPSLVKTVKEVKNKNKTLVYYVVPHVEKENVNSLPVNNTTTFRQVRSNPRSILKSSFPEIRQEPEIKNLVDERFSKRFARSKEAVQARLFNNFISKTTIPHAPVRQTRLPRKQEIKPVDNRRDEEIIVQEVMVSSNGFVENVEERLRNKEKLEVTGYVVLTDSDDDYDPKQGNRKKKKHKKHKKVNMSDSEESEVSVIEICSDEDDDHKGYLSPKRGRGRPKKSMDCKEKSENMKRRRGRPPKINQNQSDTEQSPQKKSRTESDEIESDTAKKEIKCPHCTKTFPSENSLSTHIQHHNLENSLRISQASRASMKNSTIEYKHKCDACQMNFKNSILLKRHVCEKKVPKNPNRLACNFCKKSFPDSSSLNVHKRCHVKENLVNTTTVAKVSPKKFLPRPSTSKFKSPKRLTISRPNNFKCKVCSRVCFSQESLNLHEKTHAKFTCKTCNAAFTSRILLDTHVRVSCVKAASPVNKRLSFKITKSFVRSPKRKPANVTRKSVRPSLNVSVNDSIMNNSTLNLNLECNRCEEKFTMFQDLFKHQVKVHGLNTPDKSILAEQKKSLHQPRSLHGGIQTREGMKTVFANLKSKIAEAISSKDHK